MHWELVAASSFLSLGFLWSITQTIIGIGLIIFVHELGHFLAAKSCGVKCEKFYVGFDAFDINLGVFKIPRRLFHFTWGETEYGLGILPLGGYVKMLGQHDNPAEAEKERQRSETGEGGLDPRSYMAKTVPQRMLIISAGVIMNLIFAVIFATIAFSNGVSYEPPVVGATTSGSPAWKHNLSGVDVVSVNGVDTSSRYFTFMNLAEAIVMSGADTEVDLEIRRPGAAQQTEKVSVAPVHGLLSQRGADLPTLGIAPIQSCRLPLEDPTIEGQAARGTDFQPGDVIIKVNGVVINDLVGLRSQLVKLWDQEVKLTVLRGCPPGVYNFGDYQAALETTATEKDAWTNQVSEIDVTVPPNPALVTGLNMAYSEVKEVQLGSPAYQAGIRKNDKLLSLNGQPFNPMLLEQQLRRLARDGEKAKIKVRRYEGETENELEFEVIPAFPLGASANAPGLPYAVDELGIAYRVLSEVVAVQPDSPASTAAVLPGDVITKVIIDYKDPEVRQRFLADNAKLFELSGESLIEDWSIVEQVLQDSYPGPVLKLSIKRGSQPWEVELQPTVSDEYFRVVRGIKLEPMKRIYQSPDFADAAKCGLYQVWYDGSKIFKLLKQLVVGKVPVTALGGLGTIAIGATSEAMSGTSRLLLFLTLLSVNLAVLNFLPIPVLDGGHMVFLAYEGITGRPPNEKVQEGLTMIGAILLLTLMVFALGMDAWRISGLF